MARRKKPAPVVASPADTVAKQAGHVTPKTMGEVVTCPECKSARVKKRCGNPNGGDLGYFECLACTDDEGNATEFKDMAASKVWVRP